LHLIKCVDRALTRLAQRNKGKKDVDEELKVRSWDRSAIVPSLAL
jgi:hypothetical protein